MILSYILSYDRIQQVIDQDLHLVQFYLNITQYCCGNVAQGIHIKTLGYTNFQLGIRPYCTDFQIQIQFWPLDWLGSCFTRLGNVITHIVISSFLNWSLDARVIRDQSEDFLSIRKS